MQQVSANVRYDYVQLSNQSNQTIRNAINSGLPQMMIVVKLWRWHKRQMVSTVVNCSVEECHGVPNPRRSYMRSHQKRTKINLLRRKITKRWFHCNLFLHWLSFPQDTQVGLHKSRQVRWGRSIGDASCE
jgi:hypothetical protein